MSARSRRALLLLVAALLSGCAPVRSAPATPVQAGQTLVLLVRHAEKAGPKGDVPLAAAGVTRAGALVDVARRAGVNAIITTQLTRTRQTAAPAAAALSVTPDVIAVDQDAEAHAARVAKTIRERYAGRTVLVVGHSHTLPLIVAALGGPTIPHICDSQYDVLVVMKLEAGLPPETRQEHYGSPSPPDAGCASK